MEVAFYYIEKGVPKSTILLKLNISKSSYYYNPKVRQMKAGRPMSSHTYKGKVGCISWLGNVTLDYKPIDDLNP